MAVSYTHLDVYKRQGQSGHPFSGHYDDQIDLWLNGQYLPMRSSRAAVEEAAVDHLVLQP